MLGRFGTPVRLWQLITQALEHGTTYIRSLQSPPFGTTHGVKQRCAVSCFLFVIVFDIPFRHLTAQGITFLAYVDNIATPAHVNCSQQVADAVQKALSMIGCQINVIKSEALPLVRPPPPPPSLPQYHMPPLPVQTCGPSPWQTLPSPMPAEWLNNWSHRCAGVSHLMHLGHPLPAFLDIKAAYRLIMHELRAQLQELHAHPIQTLDCILLVNTMVVPCLLYRTESLPLSNCQLSDIHDCLQRFVLLIAGLPPLVARKGLHTHRRHGLELPHFSTLHPTRVLDSLHGNYRLEEFIVRAKHPLAPYQQFLSAVNKFGPPCGDSPTPLPVVWQAQRATRAATEVVHVAGLQVYILPTTHAREAVYTDGRKLGDPLPSGAAAVLRDGRVAVCRVPGATNSYKAELIGIFLGSHFSAEPETLCLDCQGAILSLQGSKPPLREAHWVRQVRSSFLQGGQSLECVKGDVGLQDNELSNDNAKVGTPLPRPPLATRTSRWEVIHQGEVTLSPHQVWTHDLVPTHQHEHFGPVSWRPLKRHRLTWHKWLFGLQSREGFRHYATYWRDKPSRMPCAHCGTRLNDSVHGVLAHCSPTHPLVAAWLSAWPSPPLLANSRSTGICRDLWIVGCLAIPRTLYRYLALHHAGLRAARVAVGKFQQNALNAVNASLEKTVPRPSSRPCSFHPEDWH